MVSTLTNQPRILKLPHKLVPQHVPNAIDQWLMVVPWTTMTRTLWQMLVAQHTLVIRKASKPALHQEVPWTKSSKNHQVSVSSHLKDMLDTRGVTLKKIWLKVKTNRANMHFRLLNTIQTGQAAKINLERWVELMLKLQGRCPSQLLSSHELRRVTNFLERLPLRTLPPSLVTKPCSTIHLKWKPRSKWVSWTRMVRWHQSV